METGMKSIYIARRFAAKYVRETFGVRCSEKWLAKLAVTGGGPNFYKDGRSVLYLRHELETWVRSRISGPWTSSSDPEAMKARRGVAASYLICGGLPFVDM